MPQVLSELPTVTIIVLNYNGVEHLKGCFSSLTAVDYPSDRLELMLVDNASTDGSVEYIQSKYSQTHIVRNKENLGFAAGNNVGVRVATGKYVVFLNNDMWVDPQFIRGLVMAVQSGTAVVCAGAKILNWDGSQIDFGGAAAHFAGYAYQVGMGTPFDPKEPGEIHPMLYACGGAMMVDRQIFLDVGGFDEDYFIYYEDLDLGWRLWIMGYQVAFAPEAIANHRHHGTMDSFSNHRKQVLFKRNSLYTIIKNYDDRNLGRVLPAVLLSSVAGLVNQAASQGQLDLEDYFIKSTTRTNKPNAPFDKKNASTLVAIRDLVEHLPRVMEKRRFVQEHRQRSDEEVARQFRSPFLYWPDVDVQTQYRVADAFNVQEIFQAMARRVLIISSDILPYPGLPTVGSGLRAWGLGEGLKSRGHEVLYSMPRAALEGRETHVSKQVVELAWRNHTLLDVIRSAQPDVVVVCNWPVMALIPVEQLGSIPVVLDQHGPHKLEREFQKAGDPAENAHYKILAFKKADYFTCAGSKQQNYFRSWLERAGWTEREIQERIGVIPVSLSPDLPERHPGEELSFVYGGVFLPWQDPSIGLLTLVEKLNLNNRGKLKFYGGKHPVYPVDTGVFDQLLESVSTSPHVVNKGMISHDELIEEYTRSHVAIDLMKRNQERELAFTTRTVEYLWCGLPVIYNDYSELSNYIREYNAGWVVNPEDRQAINVVLDEIFANPGLLAQKSENARRLIRQHLTWDRTIDPIDYFVRHPSIRQRYLSPASMTTMRHEVVRVMASARFHFRRGGLKNLGHAGFAYLKRRLG